MPPSAIPMSCVLLLSACWGVGCTATETRPANARAELLRGWEAIERSAARAGRGTEAQVQELLASLQRLEAEEIVAFDVFLQEQLERAYRWDLWAVAYLVMGGCSDDSFLTFRAWLIAQGETYFEAALNDPPSAALAIQPGDRPGLESLLYVAANAHEAVAGRALPLSCTRPVRREPAGIEWEESEVDLLYPELATRFGRRCTDKVPGTLSVQ